MFGDSTFKVFGNAGRYALPLTPSVAVRGASRLRCSAARASTSTSGRSGHRCADRPDRASRHASIYLNGEYGQPKNPLTIASQNLDPMYQDEYILGFQKLLTDHLSLGVRGIYRDLKPAIDDNCDYTAILEQSDAERA